MSAKRHLIFILKTRKASSASRSFLQKHRILTIMSTAEKFQKAVEDVKKLKSKPTDEELLELYALFKQATVGDCNTTRPGLFDLKGKAKWDAWDGKKGMKQSEAEEAYVVKANTLIEIYGLA